MQLSAAVIALKLIGIIGTSRGWILISIALVLMSFRRACTLVTFYVPVFSAYNRGIIVESIAILTSILMVVGVYLLSGVFLQKRKTEMKLKQYSEELMVTNKKLKSIDMMKDDFLSNVNHELKTPLVSVEGYSELLSDGTLGELNDRQKKAVDTIIRNAKRLERLIDSIMYLSIEKAGRMQYTFKPLQIDNVIEQSVLDMLPQINKHNLNIKKDVQDNLPLIQADKDKIMQVIINLVGNAIKFTPSGEIVIKAYMDDEKLHIEINDTGVGIPEEHINNLFDRFYQGNASTKRKYGGTGLGLHISKHIVEAHHGKIWAESEKGIGTTIHVTLPK